MTRVAWLERHDEFEGVGAHELNPRYDHVDGGDWDEALRELVELDRKRTPALFLAQRFLAALTVPIRFDGADISHYQPDKGPIDWALLRAASWWFATKATQSIRSVDPTFATHWRESAAHSFGYRLAYHWLSSTTDPTQQADHYLNIVGALKPGDGVMLDAEEAGITVDKVLEWCERVERFTRRPCSVYSGAYVAGGTIWQSTAVRTSAYGPRPMHLAAYTTEAKALSLPGVKAYPWSAWQYSSNGPVPGIVGRCDMNRVDKLAHYDLACGNTQTPPPVPQPQGDDVNSLLIPTDDPNGAQFYAQTNNKVALSCRWTGPGDNGGKVDTALAAHKAAGLVVQNARVVDFLNIALDGPMPPGWTAERFRNTDEIRDREAAAGTIDFEARAAFERQDALIVKLNDAVGRNGQEIHEVRVGLGKLAPN